MTFRRSALLIAAVALAACSPDARTEGPLVVYNAGSLARPLRAALDTFARRERVAVEQESAGSLEAARKLTELGKIPDLIALADAEVFPGYLVPVHVERYVRFARNRMVLAYTDRSKHAAEITSANWWEVLQRPGVAVGRSDPEQDPNGYRTLMVWQLAERATGERGLAARLAATAPPRNVRSKEADLIGLLEAGEFDYIWSYESIARSLGFRWVALGDSVDLADPTLSEFYANARVTVRGRSADAAGVTFLGEPIVYAFAVPLRAAHSALGERFAAFLLSADGRAILAREGLDVLERPDTLPAVVAAPSAPPAAPAARP